MNAVGIDVSKGKSMMMALQPMNQVVLKPLFIKQSGGGSIRKVKTDKADARKIAKYGLDNWTDLREYAPIEAIREQLKLAEGKPYFVYMTAAQNKFLRIYYARVKECLLAADARESSES